MMDSVLTSSLTKVIRDEIKRKQKQYNCDITLWMDSSNPSAGVEMHVLYLNPLRMGETKKIADSTDAALVATGVIRYFKEAK